MEFMRRGEPIFGDSAYPIPTVLLEGKQKGLLTLFCEKGKRNQPLSNDSKILNKHLSKVRSRVEHVFADIKSFGGKSIRCRGLTSSGVADVSKQLCLQCSSICFLIRGKLCLILDRVS
ncbi:transposase [Leptospira noguchii]|uniref:transposase n=1 Tax=Leptospira noguchii TaxID=28182 RepID=UPI0026D68047